MNRLVDWIKRHQVAAFFIITFAITWGLGFSWDAIIRRQQFLWLPLAFAATCGPGIAGIVISAVTGTEPRRGPRRTFWIALVAAWLVSLLVSLANSKFLRHSPVTPMSVGLFAVAVLPVTFVVASAWSRNPSVRHYLASLVRFRGTVGATRRSTEDRESEDKTRSTIRRHSRRRRTTMIGLDPLYLAALLLAQATADPSGDHAPTPAETRATMGIASTETLRGQRDTVGYASTPEQMKTVWELSAEGPAPDRLGPAPAPGALAVLSPHDDYIYASRVYRTVLPLVTAKTVIVVGVFHAYRKYGVRDRIVFDTYKAWRTPDGPVPVSDLRGELLAAMPPGDVLQDDAAHDAEHSIEADLFWLRHANPGVTIVPILAPASRFERVEAIAGRLGDALAASMNKRGWTLGRDVAIVISADAVHYGPDFDQVPFGDGGIEAYTKAVARDRALLTGPFAGPVTVDKVRELFGDFVDPAAPDTYRLSWCGRFSIPFGMLLLKRTAEALGLPAPNGLPLCYATSISAPELRVRAIGLGATAPSNLYHFVGYPGVAWVAP